MVYKSVSKCLDNRLNKTLGMAISETQEAFIAGRQIHDNTIIGYEGLLV